MSKITDFFKLRGQTLSSTKVLVGDTSNVAQEVATTGTGSVVLATGPTLSAPVLGTPASGVATNLTGTATGLTSGITNALKSATTTVDVSAATAPTNGQVLTATAGTTATWQTPAAGGSPPNYIVGFELGFSGTTTITCNTGIAYIESLATTLAGDPADATSVSVTAAIHYVYLFSSTGTPTLEISATAPVAYATPCGNARSKSGDTSRRYLGQYVGDGSKICEFQMADLGGGYAEIAYQNASTGAAPYRVVSNGTATTYTNVSIAGVCPPNTTINMFAMMIGGYNTLTGNAAYALFHSIDGTNDMGGIQLIDPAPALSILAEWLPIIRSTPNFYYKNVVTSPGSGPSAYIDVRGYTFVR